MVCSSLILKNETDSRAYVNTRSKKISEKNPARRAGRQGEARTRSPSQLPGQTVIGTKAFSLLFLRRKVARRPRCRPLAPVEWQGGRSSASQPRGNMCRIRLGSVMGLGLSTDFG